MFNFDRNNNANNLVLLDSYVHILRVTLIYTSQETFNVGACCYFPATGRMVCRLAYRLTICLEGSIANNLLIV